MEARRKLRQSTRKLVLLLERHQRLDKLADRRQRIVVALVRNLTRHFHREEKTRLHLAADVLEHPGGRHPVVGEVQLSRIEVLPVEVEKIVLLRALRVEGPHPIVVRIAARADVDHTPRLAFTRIPTSDYRRPYGVNRIAFSLQNG